MTTNLAVIASPPKAGVAISFSNPTGLENVLAIANLVLQPDRVGECVGEANLVFKNTKAKLLRQYSSRTYKFLNRDCPA
jgi:hypothetical protein